MSDNDQNQGTSQPSTNPPDPTQRPTPPQSSPPQPRRDRSDPDVIRRVLRGDDKPKDTKIVER